MLLPAALIFGLIYQAAGARAAVAFSNLCALGAAILLPLWALRGGDAEDKPPSRTLRER